MNRRGDSRLLVLLAAALAALLVWAPAAVAAEPATDEYNVEVPSTNDVALGGGGRCGESIVDQAGVAGETPSAVDEPARVGAGQRR